MNQEDATKLLIQLIRNPKYDNSRSINGYDIYLPSLIRYHFNNKMLFNSGLTPHTANQYWEKFSNIFYDAA